MICPLCNCQHFKIEFQCGFCQQKYCSIKCFLSEEEDPEEYWFGRSVPDDLTSNYFKCCQKIICGQCLKDTAHTECQICNANLHTNCSGDLGFLDCACLLCVNYGHPDLRAICYDCHNYFHFEPHPTNICCCCNCIEDRNCLCNANPMTDLHGVHFSREDFHCETCHAINRFKTEGYCGDFVQNIIDIRLGKNQNDQFDYLDSISLSEEAIKVLSILNNFISFDEKNIDPYEEDAERDYIDFQKQLDGILNPEDGQPENEIPDLDLDHYNQEFHNKTDILYLFYLYLSELSNISGCSCDYCRYFRKELPTITSLEGIKPIASFLLNE